MTRFRYWKLTSDDAKKLTHDVEKILNWEIKGVRKPESDAKFIGMCFYIVMERHTITKRLKWDCLLS